ncbi:MAG: hypothetical protein LKE39_03115 [Sphaerochaeta sp.]|nr:hypothetical protein [Sphaerochaeta sp.]
MGRRERWWGSPSAGGMVCTYEINGFPVIWQADTYAVLAWDTDRPSQELENPFGDSLVQVSEAKDHEGRNAWFLEFSEPPKKEKIASVFGSGTSFRFFPCVASRGDHHGPETPVVPYGGRMAGRGQRAEHLVRPGGHPVREGFLRMG